MNDTEKHLPADPLNKRLAEEHLKQLMKDVAAHLATVPDHWHDDATVNLRDNLKALESIYGKS